MEVAFQGKTFNIEPGTRVIELIEKEIRNRHKKRKDYFARVLFAFHLGIFSEQ